MMGNTGILASFDGSEQPMQIEQRQSVRRKKPVEIRLQVNRREIALRI